MRVGVFAVVVGLGLQLGCGTDSESNDSTGLPTGVTATSGEADPETSSSTAASPAVSSSGTAETTDTGGDSSSDGTPGDDEGVFDVAAGETSGALDCDPEEIPDTVEFVLSQTIEVGVSTLQAAYYDTVRDEITVLSYYGTGKVFDPAGNELRDVMVPPEALPQIDGGAYDAARDVAMLLRQDCTIVEVDPATMTTIESIPLGTMHSMSICAGLAIAPNGNLYIASYGTNELVVVTPMEHDLVFRRNLASIGFGGIDGIAEIAGSENFLVNSTMQAQAMILDADGEPVVPAATFGNAPLSGMVPVTTLDSMVTICSNGHTWLCDEYGTTCSDFAPADGDKAACGCLVAG